MKEKIERYQKFFEMAKVGQVDDLIIEVYSDHNPPHFHVTKKDMFEVRLEIGTLKILSYKWQKDSTTISSSDIKKISKWLNKKHVKKNILNKDVIDLFWDSMNS